MDIELLLRVLIAGICGVLIGFERKNRMKEAGVRTHYVVAAGAALMIIISKYGFQDQIGWSNLSLDPSRIAAGVVSGVGFLGAGMIFMQKQTVKGLTTAAGIWATAGIGMAVGAGMYFIGIAVTLLLLLGQIILHGRYSWLTSPKTDTVTLVLKREEGIIDRFLDRLEELHVSVLGFEAECRDEEIELELTVQFKSGANLETLLSSMNEDIKRMKVE
ncbi:MAG: MgtC/SapB family protein [Paenibacillus macerans]|uniref:MgtC family protein n=2 Tax=Paenibacillus macerans TaxID=44252 RepID=A0A090XZZ2_PAEMA|nr:MgtC/SapB family protein [Paenibacillus macerans]KFM91122.1 mgtC family protein [Paenibacillus macerans]MCY7562661.1 MgtC/SapB family protein [Paenibacillus macerans]MDU5946869.1 MgtC/SapB family protein [Paenibacillus macerans]MDU7477560.1 MgtC/SapB family protein [Paenibacillus macerans]MEC0135309.1 MgtC/SapB family protein [Paenibacillus macerans]